LKGEVTTPFLENLFRGGGDTAHVLREDLSDCCSCTGYIAYDFILHSFSHFIFGTLFSLTKHSIYLYPVETVV